MDLTFNDAEAAFRDELRAWLAGNAPTEEPPVTGTPTTRGGARSSATSRRPATRRCSGRPSTAAAARR